MLELAPDPGRRDLGSEDAARKFEEERVEPVRQQVGIKRPEPQRWQVHNLVMRGA